MDDIRNGIFECEYSDDLDIKERIEQAESKCNPFELLFQEKNGKFGIRFNGLKEPSLVNPIHICSSLFCNKDYQMLFAENDISNCVTVAVRRTTLLYEWCFSIGNGPIIDTKVFTYNETLCLK